ncbi:hypothetical protein OAA90_03190 [Salibacteraceae bacterium]|jgi:hypothetical protein|nr:hypothetical protein [Salibacteraceae bacterium]
MKKLSKVVLGFLLVGLFSCSMENPSLDSSENNASEVHLELVFNSDYRFDHQENKTFIEGVEFVQHFDNKLLVKVDVNKLELASAKRKLKSKGFNVVKQYEAEGYSESQALSSQRIVDRSIKIPEITFPNVFKALVVFYR